MVKYDKDKQFVVIGLGRFGRSVATTLYSLKKDVLCIDKNADVVNTFADTVPHIVQADTRDEEVLKQLDICSFDTAIIGINDIESSVMTTLLLQDIGVKEIVAKASTITHKKALYKVGASKVIQPEKEMGARVAKKVAFNTLIDYIELSDQYSIFEIICPEQWIGKTIIELDIRRKYQITILGVKRDDNFSIVSGDIFQFQKNDIIISLGSSTKFYRQLEKI